jgi:hypothetical protein
LYDYDEKHPEFLLEFHPTFTRHIAKMTFLPTWDNQPAGRRRSVNAIPCKYVPMNYGTEVRATRWLLLVLRRI